MPINCRLSESQLTLIVIVLQHINNNSLPDSVAKDVSNVFTPETDVQRACAGVTMILVRFKINKTSLLFIAV